jgi:C1A family cysteine protease
MKLLQLLIVFGLLAVFPSCRRDLSCESCLPPLPNNTVVDTLPPDYPFKNGVCENGASLGLIIPFHDSVKYSWKDTLPDSLQLDMPIPGDQMNQGSCAAWATVYAAGSYSAHVRDEKPYADTTKLSPKYTYNQITKGNCGCTSIHENLYLLETQGACSLPDMPYNPNECLLQPDSLQQKKAAPYRIKGWLTVDATNITLIKEQLVKKMPVIFATNVDKGFSHLQAPYLWKERIGDGSPHAMVVCGYDDKRKAFRIINSWSTRWADKGFAWVDYAFFVKNLENKTGYVIIN